MDTRSACPHCGTETKNAHGLRVHVGREHRWPACTEEGCDRPAKANGHGNPRRLCSMHAKRAETEANRKPCSALGCELPRTQARGVCKWHSVKGPDAVMDPATLARSAARRAA